MITDEEIDRALNWLVANAGPAAKARAEVELLREFRKSKKAILMSQSDAGTINAKEMDAYKDPEYLQLLEALKAAVEEDEKFRWLQVAAETKIRVWQSNGANQRIQAKVT